MVGWDQRLNGHEFEQALGDSDGQGGLACYSPSGRKELDTTDQLNNNKSKSEKERHITYMWNLKRTYLQNRNRITDIENNFKVAKGTAEREGLEIWGW